MSKENVFDYENADSDALVDAYNDSDGRYVKGDRNPFLETMHSWKEILHYLFMGVYKTSKK